MIKIQQTIRSIILNKLFWLMLMAFALLYTDNSNARKHPIEPYLYVKPKICITRTNKEPCDASVYAEWLYLEPVSACLFTDGATQPVFCWDNKDAGSTDFKVNSAENIILYLRKKKSQQNLLSAKIEVMSKGIRVKNLRRKKRNAWSIF